MQRLSLEIGDSLAGLIGAGDSVRVLVHPSESAWFIESPILKGLSGRDRYPTQSASAAREIDVGLLSARVEYSNVRQHGIFSGRMLNRTISVEMSGKVVDWATGVILANGNMARSSSDTINASDVDRLENPGIPATRGTLPPEGFFASIVEPIVMVSAVAVAVFLLFRIRS